MPNYQGAQLRKEVVNIFKFEQKNPADLKKKKNILMLILILEKIIYFKLFAFYFIGYFLWSVRAEPIPNKWRSIERKDASFILVHKLLKRLGIARSETMKLSCNIKHVQGKEMSLKINRKIS